MAIYKQIFLSQIILQTGLYTVDVENRELKSFSICSDRYKARRAEVMWSQYRGEKVLYDAKLKLWRRSTYKLFELLFIENSDKAETFLNVHES